MSRLCLTLSAAICVSLSRLVQTTTPQSQIDCFTANRVKDLAGLVLLHTVNGINSKSDNESVGLLLCTLLRTFPHQYQDVCSEECLYELKKRVVTRDNGLAELQTGYTYFMLRSPAKPGNPAPSSSACEVASIGHSLTTVLAEWESPKQIQIPRYQSS
jgi:hypothetical protein